eukprot:Lithocolla_globosa_v1_NODE_48_length_7768_cov_556.807727.p5 type:complete len:118 gc:universal NODE_48_length_7768_cov_556.807727:5164-4811(-)
MCEKYINRLKTDLSCSFCFTFSLTFLILLYILTSSLYNILKSAHIKRFHTLFTSGAYIHDAQTYYPPFILSTFNQYSLLRVHHHPVLNCTKEQSFIANDENLNVKIKKDGLLVKKSV